MEKQKFEFQKLELPKQILKQEDIYIINTPEKHNIQSNNTIQTVYFVFLTLFSVIIGFCSGYLLKKTTPNTTAQTVNAAEINSLATQKKPVETALIQKEQEVVTSKPIYFNYYDSIVFLNQVHGEKLVIAKGIDEYIKKKKIVVKVNDNYYNIFSADLVNNYSVGDKIP